LIEKEALKSLCKAYRFSF